MSQRLNSARGLCRAAALPDRCPRRTVGSVQRYELLTAHERLPARPFTDPERTAADAGVMNRMLGRLRRESQSWPSWQKSVEMLKYTADGCRHWLVVPSPSDLEGPRDVTAIGFFGDLRPEMDHSAIYALEAEVVARLAHYAPVGLLGYYDAELAPALHGNLVLFRTREVPSEWHGDRVHARAVAIAPHHYSVVRLHRGIISGALLGQGHLVIERTRYFDFSQQPAWQAIRDLG